MGGKAEVKVVGRVAVKVEVKAGEKVGAKVGVVMGVAGDTDCRSSSSLPCNATAQSVLHTQQCICTLPSAYC